MADIVSRFRSLLARTGVTEPKCQSFLEQNTELIYTPFLLSHWIHSNCIISKFPLDTSLVTDFVYLTKSSDYWHIVLVELEHPHKRLFRESRQKIIQTEQLTEAMSQIHSWQEFVQKNEQEVLRRLAPLRKPLAQNPVLFKYLLVIGRSDEKSACQAMRDRLANLSKGPFMICTYDTLISAYQKGRPQKKNILRLTRTGFAFKYLNRDPIGMLACNTPDEIFFNAEQREAIIAHGYKNEIEKWEQGNSRFAHFKTSFQDSTRIWGQVVK